MMRAVTPSPGSGLLFWMPLVIATTLALSAALLHRTGLHAAPPLEQGAQRASPLPRVQLRSVGGDIASGVAQAVVVEEGWLVHTALMLPENQQGVLEGAGDAAAQAARVLGNIDIALKEARTSLDHLVRLHVYVADASIAPQIDGLLKARFGGRAVRPAATIVETDTTRPGVLVAMDAVAATAWTPGGVQPARLTSAGLTRRSDRASHAAVQPSGPFVVVSGRAAPGDFEPAIRETMAQLRGDLERAGLTFDAVVQIKSFVTDVRRAADVQAIVAASFGGRLAPPQVIIGCRLEGAPAEIELMASAPSDEQPRDLVEHTEPILGRYSRVARVNGGRPVFISGLFGTSAGPVAQVDDMFAALQGILHETGSSIRHLVKATYYVSDPAADGRINAIRPTVYDAAHPPAASKLPVRGTGRAGKASTFDMIAAVAAR